MCGLDLRYILLHGLQRTHMDCRNCAKVVADGLQCIRCSDIYCSKNCLMSDIHAPCVELSTRRVTKQVPLEEDTSGSSIPASNNVHKGPANLLETVDKVLDSSSDD